LLGHRDESSFMGGGIPLQKERVPLSCKVGVLGAGVEVSARRE
jgi:hypothetical protein